MCNIPVSVRRENGGNSLKMINTNTISTRRNNPKWYHFVDKEANKKGYAERQKRFNEHYKE